MKNQKPNAIISTLLFQLKFGKRCTLPFTLIELLFVIVILTILMAILLPSLTIAKEYAYQTYCMNNMKQIGLGYREYTNDYDGYYPMTRRWLDDFSPVYPYIKSFGVFICPKTNSPELTSESDLIGKTDYLVSGELSDIEKCENNGHGNNDYNFDISNPSPVTATILSYKKDERLLYERNYRNHFDSFNVIYLEDLHYETDKGVSRYWTLDKHGRIETSLEPYPDL